MTRTAVLGPGCCAREVREATIKHGLHFPGGHNSTVAAGGFITGMCVKGGRGAQLHGGCRGLHYGYVCEGGYVLVGRYVLVNCYTCVVVVVVGGHISMVPHV